MSIAMPASPMNSLNCTCSLTLGVRTYRDDTCSVLGMRRREPKLLDGEQQVHVQVALDPDDAEQVAAWMTEHGASDVDTFERRSFDLDTATLIVTGVLGGSAIVAAMLSWLRRQTRSLLIIDVRGGKVVTRRDSRERSGRTIIIADDSTAVEVLEPGELLDLNALAQAAVEKGVEAAVGLALEAGGQAQVVQPPSAGAG